MGGRVLGQQRSRSYSVSRVSSPQGPGLLRKRTPPTAFLFFFTDTATTEIYTLSLHDALPIFATQRRVIVGYDDINPLLRQAIIATEDADFDRHVGINVWRIASAVVTDLLR